MNKIRHIQLSDNRDSVIILDQTQLPQKEVFLSLKTKEEMFDAIKLLKVRGAPAIGIFAAFSLAVLSNGYNASTKNELLTHLRSDADYLISSRPTAVNLSWAANRMCDVCSNAESESIEEIINILFKEAEKILEEDISMCKAISEFGLSLIKDGDCILTHCNAGEIATSKYGTALGPILLGTELGYVLHVYSDETRPLLQGARLTSYELSNAGVDVTLICDNMASLVMSQGKISCCFVGCDRIASNGDTANKIGTSGVAILAKHYGIPFYVLGPSSSIDPSKKDGSEIPIELRDPDEIKSMWYKEDMAPNNVKCYNPSFDITDHDLITAIITEKGIHYPPYNFK